jgi:DnaJ-class molecular chaperone
MPNTEKLSYECPNCKGTGGTPLKAGDDCGVCKGDGLIWNEKLLTAQYCMGCESTPCYCWEF